MSQTATTRVARSHTTPVTGSSQLLTALSHEWCRIHRDPEAAVCVGSWTADVAVFDGQAVTTPGQLLDELDTAGSARTDQIVLMLLDHAQQGHPLAQRVLLQAMLPALVPMTRRTRGSAEFDDHLQLVLATFLEVANRCTTTSKVPGRLVLDTLHQVTAPSRRRHLDEQPLETIHATPTDSEDVAAIAIRAADTEPDHEATGTELLAWACTKGFSPVDAALITEVYLTHADADTGIRLGAARCGVSHGAYKRRAIRARNRLIALARTSLPEAIAA